MANTTTQKGQDAAARTADQAKGAVSGGADKAKDMAHSAIDMTKEAAQAGMEKARDAASSAAGMASNAAESTTSSVGSGMESLAGSIRDYSPGGMLGGAASTVADSLEKGGRYIREEGLSGIADDLTDTIRRNPIPSVLVAVALGFLMARATRS
jgi:hypothetical protein